MKKVLFIIAALVMFMTSCYKVPSEKGFLSDFLSLKGADTIEVSIGGKGYSDVAWLDGSTEPCEFSIENVRDANGNTSDQFFQTYLYRTWKSPYNWATDTTIDLINAKLGEFDWPALMINPVNGQIQYIESSSNLKDPGDVYHVDVKVKNPSGEKIYEDYTILKLTTDIQPYKFYRGTVAIILLNAGGEQTFTLYDYISEADLDRIQSIYDRTGEELIDIYKESDEPNTGVKIKIQYLDSEGSIFDSEDYATYSEGTRSYFDYAVNRQNLPDGAMIEFPTTPWPADQGLLSYLKGGTADFTVLDTAALHTGVYANGEYPSLNAWPVDSWGASKWYIRLRSRIVFYEPGTWVISCKFPYTHLDHTF